MKSSLSIFGIWCMFENSVPNSRYYILQKYAGAVRFRCGSQSHGRRHCHASVYCEWCHLDGMPCTHCGVVGYYMGRLSLCPKWRSRPAAGRTSAAVAPVAELDADIGDGDEMRN